MTFLSLVCGFIPQVVWLFFLSIIYILCWHYNRDHEFSTIIVEFIWKSLTYEERKEILDAIKYIDIIEQFNDDDDTACDLIENINNKYSEKMEIYFGNGGDRTNQTTPEIEYCDKNSIGLIWDLGGGKIQSSSDLLKSWDD